MAATAATELGRQPRAQFRAQFTVSASASSRMVLTTGLDDSCKSRVACSTRMSSHWFLGIRYNCRARPGHTNVAG